MVTALNLFAGFLSVIHSIQGDYLTASWLIVVASIMDVLDGKVARLVKSSSEFGVELDSLADVSSFGFAPSVLIYKAYYFQWGTFGVVLSFLPLIFGGLRLARFNTQVADMHEKDSFFKGLPIPSSAICLATFVVFEQAVFGSFVHIELLTFIVVLVSALMVSRIRYEALPAISFKRTADVLRLLLLAVVLVLFILFPSKAIFPAMMLFILGGLFRAIVELFRQNREDEDVSDVPAVE